MPSHPSDRAAGPGGDAGPAAAAADATTLEFEEAIEELEALVDEMEAGDLTLEASLAAYERGVKLTRHCQAALRSAELKVNQLTQDNRLEPLDPDDLSASSAGADASGGGNEE